MPPFDRFAFTDTQFYEALRAPGQTRAQVEALEQARYLFGYLEELGARTVVVEHDYIDGNYLDDYASFYVKSFRSYERHCKRLHIFAHAFDDQRLLDALVDPKLTAWLQAGYLGFIVARPLPNAVVGRTVLVTYRADHRRRYPVQREYSVHLFGMLLTVPSLPFQQQDTVLAACATVALWSAFQQTSHLFGTRAPTPAEITQAATGGLLEARPLPSKGLRLDQMVRAIRELGLEPEVFEYTPTLPLLSLLAAYTAMGLPPILGIHIEGHGHHAITVAGYSVQASPVRTSEDILTPGMAFPLKRVGLRIDALYVHDDRHGPFAKITARTHAPQPDSTLQERAPLGIPTAATGPELPAPAATPANATREHAVGEHAMPLTSRGADTSPPALDFIGTWVKPDSHSLAAMTPTFVVVPVYPKIRLHYMDAEHWMTQFAYVVTKVLDNAEQLEWELSLGTTHDIKARLRTSALPTRELVRVLLTQQPRFLWSARVSLDGEPLAELLLDATGTVQDMPVLDVLFFEPRLRVEIAQVLTAAGSAQSIKPELIAFLRTRTSDADVSAN